MADMTKRDGEKWQGRLDDACKFRQEKLMDNVKRYLSLYKGRQWGGLQEYTSRDLITVNMIFPLIRNQVGFYYYRDPRLFINPRNDRSEVNALLSEEVVNYFWKEVNVRQQMRFLIYDNLIFGHAVSEIGWRFMTYVLKKRNGERIEYHEYIKYDKPYIRRVSPRLFFFDPKSGMEPIVNSEYVGKDVFRSLDDVKKDPRYKNTRNLEANLTMAEEEVAKYGETVIKLNEVHDRKHNKLLVFAANYERPLLEMDHPYGYLEGHNFEWFQFNHIPDESFGVSQISLLEDRHLLHQI